MVLNHEEIKHLGIIESPVATEFGDASYDLTVEKLIDMSNNVTDTFTLKPQGMVYVVFKEKLVIPSDVIGFAHVKTALTQVGIMATNIGIIDPNYNGYISTLLINFGKADHILSKKDTALKVTFAKIKKPVTKCNLRQNDRDLESYTIAIQKKITHLDEKFLNLNSVENEVKKTVEKSVFDRLSKIGIAFTVGGFLVGSIFQTKGCYDRKHDMALKNYETIVSTVQENNKQLHEKLNGYELQLKTLRDSLAAHSEEIKTLKN